MASLPWLEYSGQTANELVAFTGEYRVDSVLCAFDSALQAKRDLAGPGGISDVEWAILGVMALDREVNNGGYRQFFMNTPAAVPVIVADLRRVGCLATAELTQRAIDLILSPHPSSSEIALALNKPDSVNDAALKACNEEFYTLNEIEPHLFSFIASHVEQIILPKRAQTRPDRPNKRHSPVLKIYGHLLSTRRLNADLREIRMLTQEITQVQAILATEAEREGASILYALHCSIRGQDLARTVELARQSFDLMREYTLQSVLYRDCVAKMIEASNAADADESTIKYLEHLYSSDQSSMPIRRLIVFWGSLVQQNRYALPRPAQFVADKFSGQFDELRTFIRI
jgi:hypothetical protein